MAIEQAEPGGGHLHEADVVADDDVVVEVPPELPDVEGDARSTSATGRAISSSLQSMVSVLQFGQRRRRHSLGPSCATEVDIIWPCRGGSIL